MWWLLAMATGCGGQCLDLPSPDGCAPQYEPTFDAVWENTLSPSCALSGCHGGLEGQGGLAMGDGPDAAYDAVLGYVEPGDAACSALIDHLEPEGLGDMPPGAPLADEERCAVRAWIADGANR